MVTGILNHLNSIGWVRLDPFLDSSSLIQEALGELSNAFAAENLHKRVDTDGITMQTLNGDALLELCPSVGSIYQYTLASLRQEMPDLHEIKAKPVGVSANFLRGAHDRFRMHFDRHQLTVVVYLNDAPSMPLVVYPNVRRDPILAGEKDSFDLSQMTPHVMEPRANTGLVFLGRRTWHGIENRTAQSNIPAHKVQRYSLQFGFDFDPCDYEGQSYYGTDAQPVKEPA